MLRRIGRAWRRFMEYQSDPTSGLTVWGNAKIAWELSTYDPREVFLTMLKSRQEEQNNAKTESCDLSAPATTGDNT